MKNDLENGNRSSEISSKLVFFLTAAACAGLFPYLNLYYRRLGFSPEAIAGLSTLRPWIRASCGPLFMWLADTAGSHRAFFIFGMTASVATAAAIGAGPSDFLVQAALILLYTAIPLHGIALPEAAAVAAYSPSEFGSVRLWSSIGFGVASFGTGLVVQQTGDLGICFAVFALGMAGSLVAGMGVDFEALRGKSDREEGPGAGLRRRGGPWFDGGGRVKAKIRIRPEELSDGRKEKPVQVPEAEVVGSTAVTSKALAVELDTATPAPDAASFSFVSLLTHWSTAKLALLACIWGFGTGVYDNFLFLYLDEIGTPPSLMGLGLTINTAIEVPVFLYSGKLLDRLGSTGTFHLVLAAYVARLAWYSCFMPATGLVWGSLLAEPLHGVTFALAWCAVLRTVKETVPPSSIATASAVISALWFGASYGTGALVGGQMYGRIGAAETFQATAGVIAAGWIAYSGLDAVLGTRDHHHADTAAAVSAPGQQMAPAWLSQPASTVCGAVRRMLDRGNRKGRGRDRNIDSMLTPRSTLADGAPGIRRELASAQIARLAPRVGVGQFFRRAGTGSVACATRYKCGGNSVLVRGVRLKPPAFRGVGQLGTIA